MGKLLEQVIADAAADARGGRTRDAAAAPVSVAGEIRIIAAAMGAPLAGERLAASCKSVDEGRAELQALLKKHKSSARVEAAERWRPHLEAASRR